MLFSFSLDVCVFGEDVIEGLCVCVCVCVLGGGHSQHCTCKKIRILNLIYTRGGLKKKKKKQTKQNKTKTNKKYKQTKKASSVYLKTAFRTNNTLQNSHNKKNLIQSLTSN